MFFNKLFQSKYDFYIKNIHQIQQNLIHFQPKIINTSLMIRLATTKTVSKKWTEDELKLLEKAVSDHGTDWNLISKECFKGKRTKPALSTKWLRHWFEDEIKILKDAVSKHGKDWTFISKEFFKG